MKKNQMMCSAARHLTRGRMAAEHPACRSHEEATMLNTRVRRLPVLLVTVLALMAVLRSEPIWAADACPAGAPTIDPGTQPILDAFKRFINSQWSTQANKAGVDPLTFDSGNQTTGCPSDGGTDCFFDLGLTNCEHTTFYVNVSDLTGLSKVQFNLTEVNFNPQDAAAHASAGPDAGKITDGVFAPEGTSWNDSRYSVVLPTNDLRNALVIDLAAVVPVCGGQGPSSCSKPPTVQADNNDKYQLDYSSDGTNWTTLGQFPTSSSSGLRTRSLSSKDFSARYLRVWAASGDGKYAVSELKLWNTAGQPVSLGKSAVGPRPYQIDDGVFAPNGTSWNDTQYAVVLPIEGPGHALVIDLGAAMSLCGNGFDCLSEPTIQADHNDVYQLDYSVDGVNWITYGQFPTVSNGGLQTRTFQCNTRPDLSQPCSATNHGPNFTARYVRVWAVSGDGEYSVAELKLYNTSSVLVSTGQLTSGPEPLVTNDEFAPEGTAYNDTRYATILPICASSGSNSNSNSTCPAAGAQSAAVMIDLGTSFSFSQLKLQADQNDTYQIDASADGVSWTPLATAPPVSGHGLTSRTITSVSNNPVRYLRVYATAGDGAYAVSELQPYAAVNSACGYASGANAGQSFSCSYDGQFGVGVTEFPISFTVDQTCAYLRCTNGTSSGNTSSTCVNNANCTAMVSLENTLNDFCSGSCASGMPASVLTYGNMPPGFPVATLSDLSCTKSLGSLGAAVQGVVESVVSKTVNGLFNGFLTPPEQVPSTVKNSNYVNVAIESAKGLDPAPPIVCEAEPGSTPPPNTVLKGSASRIGSAGDSGSVRLSGRFKAAESIDLSRVSLRIDELLDEIGGVGEIVRNVSGASLFPVDLQPRAGSTPTAAIYETASGVRPVIRAEVKSRDAATGLMEFSIQVDRAALPTEPSSCAGDGPASARLATTFELGTGVQTLASVHAVQDWRCGDTQLTTP
jgi:hypothetical protein